MARGDNKKIWFPSVIEKLKKDWHAGLSWEKCSDLLEEMTALRDQERTERHIKVKTKLWCRKCQTYHDIGPNIITIRAMIFALKKFGVIDDNHFKKMENNWKYYRRKHNLNGHGKSK